jgi:FdhE protein
LARGIAKLFGRRPPPPPEVQAALDGLTRLAEERPELREAAGVQAALLRVAAAAPALLLGCALDPAHGRAKLAEGTPLLRGEALALDGPALTALVRELAAEARRQGVDGADAIGAAIARGAVDPLALATAVLGGDALAVAAVAQEHGLRGDLLGTLLRFALFGGLSALAASLAPLREGADWGEGYCPTCGGWPLLAEQRGLDMQRYLRCGLCASSWAADRLRCPYCGSRDHEQLAALQVEGEEQRRAVTCDECRGYLKVLNTLTPIPPYDLPVHDLATLHLDMVALQRGYAPA